MSDTLPPRQGSGEHVPFDDDPLAELARIVAGEAEQDQPGAAGEPGPVEAQPDLANSEPFDLEAEMEQALLADGFMPAVDVETAPGQVAAAEQGDSFEDDLISALQSEVGQEQVAAADFVEEAETSIEDELEMAQADAAGSGDQSVAEAFEDALANELFANDSANAEPQTPIENEEHIVVSDASEHSVAEVEAASIESHEVEFGQHEPVFEPDAISEPHPQELTGELVAEDVAADAGVALDDATVSHDGFADHQYHDAQAAGFETDNAYSEPSLEAEFGDAFEAELAQNPVDVDGGWQRDDMQASNEEFAHAVTGSPVVATGAPDAVDPQIYQQENELQSTDHDYSFVEPEQDKPNNSMRIAFAALAFAVIAGGAVAGYGLFGGSNGTNEPVVIKADNSPIKVKPDEPGGRQIANEGNASYGKVDGKDETVDQTELVSTTEEPANVAPVQKEQQATAAPKSSDRLTNDGTQANTNASGRAGNVRPRVVKTVRVRADGSIVANQTAAPIATPTIKSIDGAKSSGKTAVPATSPVPKVQVAAATPTPTPTPTPTVAAPTPTPAPEPASTPSPAPAPAIQESEWVVQVSSVKSEEQATATFRNLQQRFAALADRRMAVQRANVNGNTFYRVRVQTASRSDANSLCSNLKAAGGSCFITR